MKKIGLFLLSLFFMTNIFSQTSVWKELLPTELNIDNFQDYKIYYTDKHSGGYWFKKVDQAKNKIFLKTVDNKTYDITAVNGKGGFIINDDIVFNIALGNASSTNAIQWFKPVEKVTTLMGSSAEILAYPGMVVASDTCLYNLSLRPYNIYVVNFDPKLEHKKTRLLVELSLLKIDYINSFLISNNSLYIYYKEKGTYANKLYQYNISTTESNIIDIESSYSHILKYKNQLACMTSRGLLKVLGSTEKISLNFTLAKKEFVLKVFQQEQSCVIQTSKDLYISLDDFKSFKKINLPTQINISTGTMKVHNDKIYLKEFDNNTKMNRIFYTDI